MLYHTVGRWSKLVEIVLFFELHQPRRFRRQFGRPLPEDLRKILAELDRTIKDAEVNLYGKETGRLEAGKVH
ncbi:MAG: hypothetical protein FJZ49_03480 [Candidatus Verstraetearchaeota archaeon]|nr:hypothetical protein [Candidatus Verstraetearchaeota archaeon]